MPILIGRGLDPSDCDMFSFPLFRSLFCCAVVRVRRAGYGRSSPPRRNGLDGSRANTPSGRVRANPRGSNREQRDASDSGAQSSELRCHSRSYIPNRPRNNVILFPVAMAGGSHLFPSRTQKLSLHALMVLGWQRPGRRCRRRILKDCLGANPRNPIIPQ